MQQSQRRRASSTALSIATLMAISAVSTSPANAEKTLYSFCPHWPCADGSVPSSALIADGAGNLYGTTYFGGQGGSGTVFKLGPDGKEAVLHAFDGDDGGNPVGGLIWDSSGSLYGTTISGGVASAGTVFKLAPDSTETVLHSFQGGNDGYFPWAGLFMDNNGNLFGTTIYGGGSPNCTGGGGGCGSVFEVEPDGTELVLYAFQGGADGMYPYAGVTADNSGNLYGVAQEGGTPCGQFTAGCGTAFKLSPTGTETVLHTFAGGSDGVYPRGTFVADSAGNLYGTTLYGGGGGGAQCNGDCGTIFRIAPDGTETVLYAFQGGSDGLQPFAGVIFDTEGNLYGTTAGGGAGCPKESASGCGTVFRLAPDGTERVLYAFKRYRGEYPNGTPLLMHGILYGTAQLGGPHNEGAVFRVKK